MWSAESLWFRTATVTSLAGLKRPAKISLVTGDRMPRLRTQCCGALLATGGLLSRQSPQRRPQSPLSYAKIAQAFFAPSPLPAALPRRSSVASTLSLSDSRSAGSPRDTGSHWRAVTPIPGLFVGTIHARRRYLLYPTRVGKVYIGARLVIHSGTIIEATDSACAGQVRHYKSPARGVMIEDDVELERMPVDRATS